MREIVLIAHNIRSTHNVGSLFRTAEGLGVSRILCCGYTPYPRKANDTRLPHISDKLTAQIKKTALGAEELVPFEYHETPPLSELRRDGYAIVGLEQDNRSILLSEYHTPPRVALILGEEVAGIDVALRTQCDTLLEIPMRGQKESFNVSVAAGIALYHLSFE